MADSGTAEKPGPGKRIMGWVGVATALIGLAGSLAGGVEWLVSHRRQQAELDARMAVAQSEGKQGEYAAAVQSYGEILKDKPLYEPALDQQLDVTMLWAENFHIVEREGQSAEDAAGPALDEIVGILDKALVRVHGERAADVMAHLGWAHWLNQHIAEREFGTVAEKDLRDAVAADPKNVYGNAMLGNWMLQTHGTFSEAAQHLQTAVATGKVRPLVRRMQFGGLIYDETPGARAELVKAANEMRKDGEPLDEGTKERALVFCCDPTMTEHAELVEALSAVPADEMWQTYLWMDDGRADGSMRPMVLEYIQAMLLEISGKPKDAHAGYQRLQGELKDLPGSMERAVEEAAARAAKE